MNFPNYIVINIVSKSNSFIIIPLEINIKYALKLKTKVTTSHASAQFYT